MNDRPVSRRKVLLSVGGLGVVTLLAACSAATPASPTAASTPASSTSAKPAPTQTPKTGSSKATATTPTVAAQAQSGAGTQGAKIVFYVWGGAPEKKVWDAEAAAFHKANPKFTVNDEILGSAFNQKLTAAFAAGTPPDSFYSGGVPFGNAKVEQLLPLDSYVKQDQVNLNDYFPVTIKNYQYKGHLYSLPNECGGYVIYYDEGLLKEAKQETPGALLAAGKWDWNHLIQVAKAASNPPNQFGFDIWNYSLIQIYAWDQGGDLVDNDTDPTTSNWNKPIGTEVLQFYSDLCNKYKIMPDPSFEQAHGGSGGVAVAMESNRLAMGVQGAWERLFLNSAKVSFKWDIGLMPKGSKTATTVGYASGCVGTAAAKHHDETWQFIKFMGSEEGNKIYAGLIAVPPLVKVANSDWFLKRPPVNDKIQTKVYLDALKASRPSINFPKINQYNQIVNNELDLVRLQKVTPQAAAQQIHTDLMSKVFGSGGY